MAIKQFLIKTFLFFICAIKANTIHVKKNFFLKEYNIFTI